jgi:hypothetical protein
MGSVAVHTNKKMFGSKEETDKDGNDVIEYTPKGNRLYRFTTVTEEERDRLRVPTYPYLL